MNIHIKYIFNYINIDILTYNTDKIIYLYKYKIKLVYIFIFMNRNM